MAQNFLTIHNLKYELLGILNDNTKDSARNINEEHKANTVSTLTFEIPLSSDKWQYIINENLVKWKGEYYFIKVPTKSHSLDRKVLTVECRHLSSSLEALLDAEITDELIGSTATQMMTYVLTNSGWTLGTVSVSSNTRTLQCSAETSKFSNLLKIAEIYDGILKFHSDTRTIDLVDFSQDRNVQIAINKNLKNLNIVRDTSEIVTRLYPYGGQDSVTGQEISIVGYPNSTSPSYIENYDYFLNQTYGDNTQIYSQTFINQHKELFLREMVWRASEYSSVSELYTDAVEKLKIISKPKLRVTFEGLNLSMLPEYFIDKPEIGELIWIIDDDINEKIQAKVTGIRENSENPLLMQIEVSNELEYNNTIAQLVDTSRLVKKSTTSQGRITTSRLDGVIDVLRNKINSVTSKWYTDDNGNMIFENTEDGSAMKIGGGIFALATQKSATTGEWEWSSFGTGAGFTGKKILAGTIEADKLDVGTQTQINQISTIQQNVTNLSENIELNPADKFQIKRDWDSLIGEKATLVDQATAFSITTEKTIYTTALTTLKTFLQSIIFDDGAMLTTSTIKRNDYNEKYIAVIQAKASLYDKIFNSAKQTVKNTIVLSDKASDTSQSMINELFDLASDNKLSATDKTTVKAKLNAIDTEKTTIETNCTFYQINNTFVSYSTYITNYNDLKTFLNPLLTSMTTESDIVASLLATKFANYYDARNNLFITIFNEAKTTALNCQTTSNQAQASGTQALTTINNLTTDNSLTPAEKTTLKNEWNIINTEKPIIVAQSDKYFPTAPTEKTNYTNAFTDLYNYLFTDVAGVSNDNFLNSANMSVTSAVDTTTLKAKFSTYYDARLVLLRKISEQAKDLANNHLNTANNITTSVRNLVRNGDFSEDVTSDINWYKWDNTRHSYIDCGYQNYRTVELSSKELTSGQYQDLTYEFLVLPNTVYSYQFMAKGQLSFYVIHEKTETFNVDSIEGVDNKTDINYTEFTQFTKTVTTTANAKRVKLCFRVNYGKSAEITLVKAEKSSTCSQWTPSIDDTDIVVGNSTNTYISALNQVGDMSADDKITATDKTNIQTEWNTISGEQTSITSQVKAFGIDTDADYTSLGSMFTTLKNYLTNTTNGLLKDMTTGLDLTQNNLGGGSTLRDNFVNYYQSKVIVYGKLVRLAQDLYETSQNNVDILTDKINYLINGTIPVIRTDIKDIITNLQTLEDSISMSVDTSTTTTYQSRNLLGNTEFLVDTSRWTLNTRFVLDSTNVYETSNSIKGVVTGQTSFKYYGISSEFIKAGDNQKFTASIYSMSNAYTGIDQGARLSIEWYNDTTRLATKYIDVKPTSNDTWTRYSVTDTSPVGTTKVRITAYIVQNGTIWFARPMLQTGDVLGEWQKSIKDVQNDLVTKVNNVELNVTGDGVITHVTSSTQFGQAVADSSAMSMLDTNLRNLAGTMENQRPNLLHPSKWQVGTLTKGTTVFDEFKVMADNTLNSIVEDLSPYTIKSKLWKCSDPSKQNLGGGYNTTDVDVVESKKYRFSVFVRQSVSTNGTVYFGCSKTDTASLNGTANTNPYFWSGDLPSLDEWYLLVGYVHESTYSGSTNTESGIYNMNGQKVATVGDFKIKTGSSKQAMRNYFYYVTTTDTNPSSEVYFYLPCIEEVSSDTIAVGKLLPIISRLTDTENKLSDMLNDNIITPLEKAELKRDFAKITAEKDTIIAQATAMGFVITSGATKNYNDAYTQLDNFLNNTTDGLLKNMAINSSVTRVSVSDKFSTYSEKKALLQKAISDEAKRLVDLAQGNLDSFKNANELMYIDNTKTTLIHFDEDLLTTNGRNPYNGSTVTVIQNGGKYGDCILAEEGTTNLIPLAKQNFTGWSTHLSSTVTLTQNQTVEEWNTDNATRIQTSGGTNTIKYYVTVVTPSVSGTSYSLQVKIKNIGSTNMYVSFNGLGSQILVSAGQTKFVTTTVTGNGTSNVQLMFQSVAVADSLDFIAYQPQVEAKSYCTSFTSSTSVDGTVKYSIPQLKNDADFTLSLWIKPLPSCNVVLNSARLISCDDDLTKSFFTVWSYMPTSTSDTRKLIMEFGSSTGTTPTRQYKDLTSSTAFDTNTWEMITFTYESAIKKMTAYRNGVVWDSFVIPEIRIVSCFKISKPNLLVDEICVFDKLLTASQIKAVYDADIPFIDSNYIGAKPPMPDSVTFSIG